MRSFIGIFIALFTFTPTVFGVENTKSAMQNSRGAAGACAAVMKAKDLGIYTPVKGTVSNPSAKSLK